ncbi:MAG: hypothetical protein WC788_05195 [Candidatus Paceibacterota bacterium]|jgi:hypothetical protein
MPEKKDKKDTKTASTITMDEVMEDLKKNDPELLERILKEKHG